MKKKVIGDYSWQEWQELKLKHKYSCVLCGISESELQNKWRGSHFTKLTADHIIPISRGGTNFIRNIQPLCISCNARKKDN